MTPDRPGRGVQVCVWGGGVDLIDTRNCGLHQGKTGFGGSASSKIEVLEIGLDVGVFGRARPLTM